MAEQKATYILRTEPAAQGMKYYASFTDGQAVFHDVEISYEVFQELQSFIKQERNLKRWGERHIEQSQLSEITLHKRALRPPENVEDIVLETLRKTEIKQAIESLPEPQRRRFFYCHEQGLTGAEIAKLEGCSQQAVAKSLQAARKNILKRLQLKK